MAKITAGLIKGRHEMPVDMYIFEDAIKDVHNYEEISNQIAEFIKNNVGVKTGQDLAINSVDEDTTVWLGMNKLEVYVTGLTPVTVELVRLCALNGIKLTLRNFNTATGEYEVQRVF